MDKTAVQKARRNEPPVLVKLIDERRVFIAKQGCDACDQRFRARSRTACNRE